MSIMTTAPAMTGEQDPYYAGRADAYDDARTLTTDQMSVRADAYEKYLGDSFDSTMYVLGDNNRLLEQRFEDAAVKAAEIVLAWTPLPAVTR